MAIWLPASMTSLTTWGASAGGIARPSAVRTRLRARGLLARRRSRAAGRCVGAEAAAAVGGGARSDARDVAARDDAVDARGRARARACGPSAHVPRPKTPSARPGKPARRSRSWSALTSLPRSPWRSVRSPSWAWRPGRRRRRGRPARARRSAGYGTAKTERQRHGVDDLSFGGAYGVSCRARAERAALRHALVTIRPRSLPPCTGGGRPMDPPLPGTVRRGLGWS